MKRARLRPARRQAGFTLVEIVLAMVLLSTMMLLLYSGLSFALRAWDAGDASGRRTADRRIGENFLRRELTEVFPMRWKDAMAVKVAFSGEADRLRFVSTRPVGITMGGLALVNVQVEGDSRRHERHLLMRRAMPDEEAKDFGPLEKTADKPTIVVSDVESVTFGYFGAENDFSEPRWMDTWPFPGRVPQLVRMRIKSADGTMLPEMVAKVMLGEEAGCLDFVPAPVPAAEADVSACRKGSQGGVALVLVLWVSVLLTVIASSFIVERRTETIIVRNSASLARAEAAADAGVHRGIYDMYRSDNSPDRWKRDGSVQDWTFDSIPVRVELRDESAKIDINTASDPLLRGLLLSSGLNEQDATRLLDAILDWRDPDSLKRPNGAEEPDYRDAGLTYKPANSAFQAIEELQLVLGMRPDLYRRLSPSITVFSRQPGVNPQIATREVLLAIPGLTPEIVDRYVADREEARRQGLPLPALPQAGGVASGNSMVATIRSEARLDDGTLFVREAVALLRPVPRKAVTFVSWRESTAGAVLDAPAGSEAKP